VDRDKDNDVSTCCGLASKAKEKLGVEDATEESTVEAILNEIKDHPPGLPKPFHDLDLSAHFTEFWVQEGQF